MACVPSYEAPGTLKFMYRTFRKISGSFFINERYFST